MQIERYADAKSFLTDALAFLMENEAENALLGIALRLVGEPNHDAYFAVLRADGQIQGVALGSHPTRLMITRVRSAAAISALAQDVLAARPLLEELVGPEPSVGELALELAVRSQRNARRKVSLRTHELKRVQLPTPIASGRLRQAIDSDLPLLARWVAEFEAAIGESGDAAELARARIASGALFVWEDGVPRSMAARARKTPNGTSVNLVYTPQALRGRGYASACVALLSQTLLDQGNSFVCLYTDIDNKTSNAIYQRLGYQPIGDAGHYLLE